MAYRDRKKTKQDITCETCMEIFSGYKNKSECPKCKVYHADMIKKMADEHKKYIMPCKNCGFEVETKLDNRGFRTVSFCYRCKAKAWRRDGGFKGRLL